MSDLKVLDGGAKPSNKMEAVAGDMATKVPEGILSLIFVADPNSTDTSFATNMGEGLPGALRELADKLESLGPPWGPPK